MSCQCRFCRRCDAHHAEESRLAALSREAQKRHDHEAARDYDRGRVRELTAAGRCLELCEGRAASA